MSLSLRIVLAGLLLSASLATAVPLSPVPSGPAFCPATPALSPATSSPQWKTCGPYCDSGEGGSLGPIGFGAATCAAATAAMTAAYETSAHDSCETENGRRQCNVQVVVTTPCYQSGGVWYVFGSATWGCIDTTC
jgi:hypothetical protein